MASISDTAITEFDRALRTVLSIPAALRPAPLAGMSGNAAENSTLPEADRRHSAALMRVNHVGEVCAQALYHAQALATSDARLRGEFVAAAREEGDHLAWTAGRVRALESHTSYLNPFWYAGAFTLGLIVGKTSDSLSVSFLAETELQVEQHLARHQERLPEGDFVSRAIVSEMRYDEIRHADRAAELGAKRLPMPLRLAMRAAAKLMTTTAYWI